MAYDVDFIRQALIADRSEGEDPELVREVARGRSILTAFRKIDRRHHPEAFRVARAERAPVAEVVPARRSCIEAGESLIESMYPVRSNGNHPNATEHQLIAENAALRRTVTQLTVRATEMEATARREWLAHDMEKWAYDREHIYGLDMSDWWPALRGELTDSLLLDLVKRRFAVDADLAANPPEPFPASLPGCLPAHRRRAQEARNAELARQSSTPPDEDPGPDD